MAMPDEEELAVPAPIFSVTCANDKEKLGLPDAHDPVTGQGRWLYEGRLGEGGLATVFRAWDCKGHLGKVAVKVLKKHSKAHARHAFAMHRESQWSLTLLHNSKDPRYSAPHAQLFARYLEDHTGFSELGPEDFNQRRRFFEHPDFDWYKQRVDLPARPYVVMELVKGETLQIAMPAMSVSEKREVVLQCATALEYLTRFQLIHRDFRGCNMHLLARENGTAKCQLKILDLGVMISSEVGMEENRNMAVQAFRRRGDTEEKRKRYDWLPWEVRDACDDVQGPVRNFQQPGHSFDIFSLGVIVLHLLVGKTKARLVLDDLKDHPAMMLDASSIGVSKQLLGSLLAEAARRPKPEEVAAAVLPPATQAPVEAVAAPVPGTRDNSHTTTRMEGSSDEEEAAECAAPAAEAAKQLAQAAEGQVAAQVEQPGQNEGVEQSTQVERPAVSEKPKVRAPEEDEKPRQHAESPRNDIKIKGKVDSKSRSRSGHKARSRSTASKGRSRSRSASQRRRKRHSRSRGKRRSRRRSRSRSKRRSRSRGKRRSRSRGKRQSSSRNKGKRRSGSKGSDKRSQSKENKRVGKGMENAKKETTNSLSQSRTLPVPGVTVKASACKPPDHIEKAGSFRRGACCQITFALSMGRSHICWMGLRTSQ
ncbi:unnamed protein product [Effrenium voratum]|nr:unnamed protein product [Effrenium voratum]